MLLPHTITIQRNTPGSLDDRGVAAQSWSTLKTARAFVQPKSVRELRQLSQSGPVTSTYSIYVEPGTGIAEADRISFGGNTFQVDGIKDEAGLGHHDKLDCHMVEV